MKLCMSLVEEYLGLPVLYRSKGDLWDTFDLESWALLTKEPLRPGVLYLTDSTRLGELSADASLSFLTFGSPPRDSAGRILCVESTFSELINGINRVYQTFQELEKSLQEAACVHHNMQMLVDRMGPFFCDSLSVCTLDFQRIGWTEGSVRVLKESELPTMNAKGLLPPEVVSFFKNDINFSRVRTLQEPFIYEKSIFSCDAMCQNVFYRGEPVCRAVCYNLNGAFRSYDRGLIQFFASFVQMVYESSGDGESYVPRNHLQAVALDLLRDEPVPAGRMSLALMARGWPEEGPFLCLSLLPSDRDIFNHTIPYYCEAISRELSGVCVFEHEGRIVCLVNLEEYEGTDDGFMKRTVEYLRDNHFLAGLSNVFTDLGGLRWYWRQADIALETGLRAAPTIWYHKFSERALRYMLGKIADELDTEHLCASQLLWLIKYDRENGSEYFKTLKKYLQSGMNAVQTAKDLYIHRGTMMYRLKRLQEMVSLDFNDPKTRLYLELSYALLEESGKV